MGNYGGMKSISISGLPERLIERYDLVAKRMVGTRSQMIRLQMENLVRNAQDFHEYEASVQQTVEHANNDTWRFFGMNFRVGNKAKNELDKN